jgi:hypothetical protein
MTVLVIGRGTRLPLDPWGYRLAMTIIALDAMGDDFDRIWP